MVVSFGFGVRFVPRLLIGISHKNRAFQKLHPHPSNRVYNAWVKFDDHISSYLAKPAEARRFDHAAAVRRINDLCYLMIAMISCASTALKIGRQLQREVRQIAIAASQLRRYELKLDMLRHPDWRLKVIKDLGGVNKLIRLWKRLSEPCETFKRQLKKLTYEEIRYRQHIQRIAKAHAHPNIYRDPFRVDQDGEFRLPPMPRRALGKPNNKPSPYNYDARPVVDFKGLKQPIMVWPDEFFVFMNWKERPKEVKLIKRRHAFMDKWLAAILADTADELPAQPRNKTQTARAPPCEILV
jgi:hypothetical protein